MENGAGKIIFCNLIWSISISFLRVFLVRSFSPLAIFYRFHSSVCEFLNPFMAFNYIYFHFRSGRSLEEHIFVERMMNCGIIFRQFVINVNPKFLRRVIFSNKYCEYVPFIFIHRIWSLDIMNGLWPWNGNFSVRKW